MRACVPPKEMLLMTIREVKIINEFLKFVNSFVVFFYNYFESSL